MFNMFSGGAVERMAIFALASCPTSRPRSSCS
jgi:preprotein translocase subunit SecY